jgi:Spy/CpxP family protein refolding chaperone
MKTFRSMTAPMFALVAALAGCSASTGTSAAAETVGDVPSGAVAAQANARDGHHDMHGGMHGHVGHGGPDFLVHAALRAPINLAPEQRTTIEGLAKAHAARPELDSARSAKLAAAIRSNTVSNTEEHNDSGREARIAAEAQALTTLHDALTAEQRTALVDSIEKRGESGKGERGEGNNREGARGPRGGEFGGPMHMLEGLELTQDQKDAIKTALKTNAYAARPAEPTEAQKTAMKARLETMRAERKAKLESFKGSSFDANAFVTPPARPVHDDANKTRVNPLAVITEVLTPAQREKLATRIEQGPVQMVPAPQIVK